MATPSSSATSSSSASPPLSYIQAAATIIPAAPSGAMDPAEREDRKKAVQKFMARAEISMVTRGLRARLSYAGYKAAHNIPHVPLRDLEAQSQSSSSRIIGAKRKASNSAGGSGGTNNYYNNPATQGIHNPPNNNANTRKGLMAPPALSASASRSYYPAPAPAARTTNATPSLYSSILAPPPAKQARTIHNPRDPPIAAPTRPPATAARPRRGSKASDHLPAPASSSTAATTTTGRPRALSLAEGTRSHAKSRRDDPVDSKRKDKRGTKGKQKGRGSSSMDLTHETVDVDMKAVATLTSLLLHSRPSMTASTTSPRSSVSAGSDSGSVQSFSQFAQSSARTTTTVPSAESSFTIQNTRSTTPPPLSSTPSHSMSSVMSDVGGTPRAHAPSDNEAADLMLFLATSPSPARPATNRDKDAKDGPAYRMLGGSPGLRAKGRVLFANSGAGSDDGRALMSDGSFGSSNGSGDVCMGDGGELPLRRFESRLSISTVHDDGGGGLSAPMEPNVIPPTPTAPTPGQLLPPPPSPSNNNNHWPMPISYVPTDSEMTPKPQAPPTPGSLSFNLNDFINVSPSPAAPIHGHGGGFKPGLRGDVGRKLFGEEQARHQSGEQLRSGGGGLGAGIDLVK